MSVPSIFSLFLLSHLLVLHSAEEQKINRNRCPESFDCGTHGPIQFPFYNNTCYSQCGLYRVNCTKSVPTLNLGKSLSYNVLRNFSDDDGAIRVNDTLLATLISTNSCDVFAYYMNWTLEATPSVSFSFSPNLTLFKCLIISPNVGLQNDKLFSGSDSYRDCRGSAVYYKFQDHNRIWNFGHIPKVCSVIHLPVLESIGDRNASNLFSVLASEFDIRVNVLKQCRECHRNGGQCSKDLQGFRCAKKRRSYLLLILGTVIPGVVLLLCLLALIIQRANKWKHTSSNISSKNTSFEPSSKADLEGGSAYFGVPVFSYAELKEATCNFDSSKELGDGGFGTVYHGKLQDGREVAVKRLYEHNYKRVKQFMNEIEILTCLSHPNLVTLYGCTSRHSQELLLVYKYIPNGTVADHLHGDRAKDGSLTWLIRLNIAIQTAGALAFLHDSDIVHRDVKTNNILLDNDFCVKVADFGLSRLFPTDVTHVSTAPQGTPGYVDPEYHQCYQLTDKSDVYSFGVVLIELVSSMPAVDVNRHRHDINLANLAINKIQSCALKELIDPSLGFESDSSIEVMTTMVAELSFRCLQLDKEMRPSMKEVLEALKEIQGYKHENIGEAIDNGEVLKGTQTPSSPEGDQITLLTNSKVPLSPDSVTNSWVSRCTTSTSTSNG